MSLVEMGTQLADPLARMKAIMAPTAKAKTSLQGLKDLLPTDYPWLLAPWLVGGLARKICRLKTSRSWPAMWDWA